MLKGWSGVGVASSNRIGAELLDVKFYGIRASGHWVVGSMMSSKFKAESSKLGK